MDLPKLRNRKGLTQNQLSERAGLSQSLISKLEKGAFFPDQIIRLKIENVLGPVDWIATKLQGIAAVQCDEKEECAENRVIREIERYANNEPDGYHFILAYTHRRLNKLNVSVLIDKATRYQKGEAVEFTDIEINTIKAAKGNLNN